MNDDERRASERQFVGQCVSDAMRLDGNAVAGILSEVFVPDITTAQATCANCETIRALGDLLVYAHGMGTVIRCPSCDGVVLRVTRTPARLWLDPRGARLIVMTGATTPLSA
jgi:hypothetical protein